PVVWTGLELVQGHLFSGFLMGALSHTQAWYPDVIQIAALTGAYGVSFVIMVFAAGAVDAVSEIIWRRSSGVVAINPRLPAGAFAAGLPLALLVFTGHYTIQVADEQAASQPKPTIALIQGDTRATWEPDPERAGRIMQRQAALSREAVAQAKAEGRRLALVVWPESMFRTPLITFDGSLDPPADAPDDRYATAARAAPADMAAIAGELASPMLVGIDRYDYTGPFDGEPADVSFRVQNSAALVDAAGGLAAIYDKTHRVPFGEYIPLFDNLPGLYFLTPLPGGVKPGEGPVAMTVEGPGAGGKGAGEPIVVSPSICYETVIPHVIHGQVRQLTAAGTPPDLLANVTNNAWFWGASELEMHLACNVFRAVENRTPMVIAANGGLSAAIDSSGRVLQKSERMTEQVLLADVPLDPRTSFYSRHGDLFAGACLIVCVGLAIIAVIGKAKGGRRKADEAVP
ncbi:MAG: apolipoprotein N-acyltransferase, partial [Planctomycetota bacterium]